MLCVDIDAKEQDSNALMLLQKLVGCAGQSMRQGDFILSPHLRKLAMHDGIHLHARLIHVFLSLQTTIFSSSSPLCLALHPPATIMTVLAPDLDLHHLVKSPRSSHSIKNPHLQWAHSLTAAILWTNLPRKNELRLENVGKCQGGLAGRGSRG